MNLPNGLPYFQLDLVKSQCEYWESVLTNATVKQHNRSEGKRFLSWPWNINYLSILYALPPFMHIMTTWNSKAKNYLSILEPITIPSHNAWKSISYWLILTTQFSSVQFSCSVVSDSLQPHESQHARPPCPSPTPGVHSDSCPPSQWCHPAISSSVVPFSSCPQSLPESESFPMSQLFAWGGQSTGVPA